jgi:hypothetical protein
MSVFQRGRIWWYKFYFAGREITESSKSKSKTVAKEAEKQRRRELEAGFHNLSNAREQRIRPLKEIIDEYLVGYRLRNRAPRFANYALGHVKRIVGSASVLSGPQAALDWVVTSTTSLRCGCLSTNIVSQSSFPSFRNGRFPELPDRVRQTRHPDHVLPRSKEALSIRRRRGELRDSGAFSAMRSTVKFSGGPDMRVEPTISRMRSSRRTWQRQWSVRHAGFTRRTLWQSRSGRRLSLRSWTNCKSSRWQPFQGSNH